MANLPDGASDGVYRPLSFLALAGFVTSCLFGGVVVLSALIAIVQGAAFFFPDWVLLLAVAAFVLSWCGLSDIRNSEETKAGQKLAVYGLWISLVTGSGYFAYSYFTGVALAQQALAFFMNHEDDAGFFPRLQAAAKDPVELSRAFLLTMPAADRLNVRAEDQGVLENRFNKPGLEGVPGNLSRFRTHPMVQNIVQNGTNATIEPLGVQEWKFEKSSYHVAYRFRVKTPEAIAEIILTARSSEGESEGAKRQWFVDVLSLRQPSLEPTLFGKGLKALREHAMVPMQQLEDFLRDEKKLQVLKLPNFERLDVTDWSTFLPDQRQELKPRLQAIFSGAARDSQAWHITVGRDKNAGAGERDTEGRMLLSMPITVLLGNEKGVVFTGVETAMIVRSKTAVDPDKIGAGDSQATMPEWEIQHVKFLRAQKKKQ